MLAFVYTAVFVVGLWLPFVWQHRALHGGVNGAQAAVSLFNAINAMICLWEMALYFHRHKVKATYQALKRKWGRSLPSPMCLFEHVSLRDALTLEHWHVIWATYCILDPSYADCKSFGFWIDTGNGLSMLGPTLLLSAGMTFDVSGLLSPRALGLLGFVANYQMLYGTVIYFSSYFHNERFKGSSAGGVAVVVVSNIIWVVFPAVAMAACWRVVRDGTLDVFHAPDWVV
jgi:hypothetical protein